MTSANEQRVDLICGVWFVDVPEGRNGGLLLEKKMLPPETEQRLGFLIGGSSLEFQENGRLIDR